jgi:hypothetical protein
VSGVACACVCVSSGYGGFLQFVHIALELHRLMYLGAVNLVLFSCNICNVIVKAETSPLGSTSTRHCQPTLVAVLPEHYKR